MRLLSAPPVAALLALGSLGLGACSADVVPDGADANTTSTHALLVVEHSMPVGDTDAARSRASVWFLRVNDQQAVGAATHLLSDELELPALGQCVVLDPSAHSDTPPLLSPVTLAFAGEVQVQSGGAQVPLVVRAFPDVANLVSGVVYTAREQTHLDFARGGQFELRATGASDFAPLQAQAQAPTAPEQVTLDGQPLASPTLQVRPGQPFTLAWTAGEAADLIYVDIDPVPGSPRDRVRCSLTDSGTGTIPPMAIPETPTMALSVHRVREVPLQADSTPIGTAHFDLALTTKVRLGAAQ